MQLSHNWCLLVFAQPAPGLSLTTQYFICYFNSVALLITFTWFYIPIVYIPQLLKALIPLHPGNPAAGYSQLWAVWFSNVVDFEYKICSKGNKSKKPETEKFSWFESWCVAHSATFTNHLGYVEKKNMALPKKGNKTVVGFDWRLSIKLNVFRLRLSLN